MAASMHAAYNDLDRKAATAKFTNQSVLRVVSYQGFVLLRAFASAMENCKWLLFLLAVSLLQIGRSNVEEADVETDFSEDTDQVQSIQKEGVASKPIKEKLPYSPPKVTGNVYLLETFDSASVLKDRWVISSAKKDDVEENLAKYDGKWAVEEPTDSALLGDSSLILMSQAKHHAVSTLLSTPFEFSTAPFMIQYELRFSHGMDCGGAYLKLLSDVPENKDLKKFNDKSPYTIMFGPDKCGESSKFHFIFRHKNPKTGVYEEKHAQAPTGDFKNIFSDKKTHIATLVLKPDNTFQVLLDRKVINSGSLLENMSPPVNPPMEIDDPTDQKPSSWDEREKIPDPHARKPDDWDENEPRQYPDPNAKKPESWLDDGPEFIPDPSAKKPADWDNEMDGEWEPPQLPNPVCSTVGCGVWSPPMIDNPKYKGIWSAPAIPNPAYKGIWMPKRIPNPDYFLDVDPFKMTTIKAVGFELWSMTDGIIFDNIIITSDQSVLDQFTDQTWSLKNSEEISTEGFSFSNILGYAKENPWMWLVYAAVLLVPLGLIYWLSRGRSAPSPADQDAEQEETQPMLRTTDDRQSSSDDERAEGSDAVLNAATDSGAAEASSGSEKEPEEETTKANTRSPPRGMTTRRRTRKEN